MKALAILALLLAPVSVHAQKTAKQLAEVCAADNPVSQAICVGYIDGARDTYMAMAAFDAVAEKPYFELTANHSTSELRDALLAYLKDHPERNSQAATGALVFAWLEHKMIRTVFPTKEEKKP